MTLIGIPGQGIREVRFYLAKAVVDLARGEPRNCGLVVRVAESSVLTFRFMDALLLQVRDMDVPPVVIDGYHQTIQNWKDAIEKHGTKSLHFIGKREGNKYANPALYIEPAFSRMVAGRVDFDAAYKRLVLSSERE